MIRLVLVACAMLFPIAAVGAQTGDDLPGLEDQFEDAMEKGDWPRAVTVGRRAQLLEEQQLGPDNIEVAGTLNLIAMAMRQMDQNREAEPLLRRALLIAEKSQGDDAALSTDIANNLAGAMEAQGKMAEANSVHKVTLAAMQERYGEKHKFTALATSNLAFNLSRQGRYIEAQQLYERALSIGRATMDEEDADLAKILNNAASNLTAQGRYFRAQPLYEQALRIRLALFDPDNPEIATSYNSLAFNLSAQGRHEDAGALYRKALDIRTKRGVENLQLATSYNNVAHNLNVRGRLKEAAPLYAKALAIWQRVLGEKHPLTAIGISNVAVNMEAQGRIKDAQSLFDQALNIRQKTLPPNHPDLASSWFKAARNFRLQGKLVEADAGYDNAIGIRRQTLGALHPELALALADHAELALLQGPGKSVQALERAREAASIARKRREQSIAGQGAGDGSAEQQALARAKGTEVLRADPLAQTFGVLLQALWARAQASPNEADALKLEAFEAAQDLETSVAALTMAQTAARAAVGSGPLTQLVREQQDLSARAFELDRRLFNALKSGNQAESIKLRNDIAATGEALSRTDAALRKQFPDYAELVQPRALTAEGVQNRLADNEGLLLMVPVGDDVFAFGVSRQKSVWARIAGGNAEATTKVRNLRCQIDEKACPQDVDDAVLVAGAAKGSEPLVEGYAAYDRRAAHDLYRDLVAPVESGFAGKSQLFVTVSGSLGGLPLGVLVTEAVAAGQDGADPGVLAATQWLADRYALIALPSVSVLRALKRKPLKQADSLPFVGYGAPVLTGQATKAAAMAVFQSADEDGATLADPEALRALAPLPATTGELTSMAETLMADSKAVVTGAGATESAVRSDANLSRARIVAFATHGVLPREVSGIEEPGLVFTPPLKASGNDDGLLAASEVARLSLNADWVLLSACNTASSDGTPGADSLSSLARSFLYAGASALLASHWRVSDTATARLTVETLAGRANGKLSRAQALQSAMKIVRTGKRADGTPLPEWDAHWAHPSAWGAFTVISNVDE